MALTTRESRPAAVLAAALVLSGCGDRAATTGERASAAPPPPAITSTPLPPRGGAEAATLFTRLPAAATGVEFENRFEWEHALRHLYAHGYAGGGVAVGDYDGDDRPDIYLVSQTGHDRLYRQVGGFRFEDVTARAGLPDAGDPDASPEWGTGAIFADVDDDGRLDLYVCNYDAPNRLYMNNGDGTFAEEAADRGLAFDGASVMAGFADYDRDGDLDVYLLTNRIYPGGGLDHPRTAHDERGRVQVAPGHEESFAIQERLIDGRVEKYVVKAGQRDRLYRNDGTGRFTDVSEEAGITGLHPGLSATWWDHDHDGWPDLYVANDFWDADRLYRNNGDGTFTDVLAERVPHTPWFSMGADVGDLNNDGRFDFIAADMSATTHFVSKLMMGDMNESRWFLESAEPRQYMRNAVYLNTGTDRFMEVAYLTHLASTDWTWSVKIGDFDNDGLCDVFVTNGTANHSFDPDLTRRLRGLEQTQDRMGLRDPVARWEQQWKVYRTVPPRKEVNLALRNRGDLDFERVSEAWGLDLEGISFGAAKADLDRDGDLDLVVSNVDEPVAIYRNDGAGGHRVLLRLRGAASNRDGLGATVHLRTAKAKQVRYVTTARGYMSADEPLVHFGLGDEETIASLAVEWPSGHVQQFADLAADRFYTVHEPPGAVTVTPPLEPVAPAFREVATAIGLDADFRPEPPYDDFEREPLLPAKLSQRGPGLAWGDADGDGDDDVYIGGPAGVAGRLLVNDGGAFEPAPPGPWLAHTAREDIAPLWIDADSDGDLDLFVASGSVECAAGDARLGDRLYLNDGAGTFTDATERLPATTDSAGAAVAADWDGDGDVDLFVGARSVPGRYPETPVSRLLRNDGGRFVDVTTDVAPGLEHAGLVTGALFSDADGDGRPDLFVTLEWGPVAYWRNTGDGFVDATSEAGLADRLGWWNAITGGDLDRDGDIDYVVMNTGLNTKYKASAEKPALLYAGDFDGTGTTALVEAKEGDGRLLPVRGLSCSSEAMPIVRERMPTYRDFAAATLPEIYTEERVEEATVYKATELAGGVLMNEGGSHFTWRPLPRLAQAAPGYGVLAGDFTGDGNPDVYFVQNSFAREPETGHWDGGVSLLLRGDGAGNLDPVWPAESGLVVAGDAKGLAWVDLDRDGRPDFVTTRNDRAPAAFLNDSGAAFLAVRLAGPPGNPTAIGARVTAVHEDGSTQTQEIYGGGGYLSQSAPELYFGSGGPAGRVVEVRIGWTGGTTTNHAIEAGATRLTLRAR